MAQKPLLTFGLLFTLLSLPSFGQLKAQETLNYRQKRMLSTVEAMENAFETFYAPKKWKEEHVHWDLNLEMKKVKEAILKDPNLSAKSYQLLLNDFINSVSDYHVSISFYATEKATLPFSVTSADGHYFLGWIDREKLSPESFPFEVGDEIVEFANRPIQDEIDFLKKSVGTNTAQTDQALAQIILTKRRASRGIFPIPQGAVDIGILKEGKVFHHQLAWDYVTESIFDLNNKDKNFTSVDRFESKKMISPWAFEMSRWAKKAQSSNPYELGARKSFLGNLGQPIWSSSASSSFWAYIYRDENKNLIGVVRISSYDGGEKEALEFEQIIKRFEATTDAMVIDQLNNPGGSVFYLYSLVSMLTEEAIKTPLHHMIISPSDVSEALEFLQETSEIDSDEEAQKYIGKKTSSGYPITKTFITMARAHYQFILDEWKKGKTLTDPYHIWGVSSINPHAETRYTKPIVVLINELDFSGGDFFPAILQDSKRATILGTRTAGAGGYVNEMTFPDMFGLEGITMTGSLAKRVNDRPLENLGVSADIQYSFSLSDLKEEYKDYKAKIAQTLGQLLETPADE